MFPKGDVEENVSNCKCKYMVTGKLALSRSQLSLLLGKNSNKLSKCRVILRDMSM
jgi:hypothetical protein